MVDGRGHPTMNYAQLNLPAPSGGSLPEHVTPTCGLSLSPTNSLGPFDSLQISTLFIVIFS